MDGGEELTVREIAVHEAGHAVAATWFRIPFTKVTIVADDEAEGRCSLADDVLWVWLESETIGMLSSRVRTRLEAHIMARWAGVAAQARFRGEADPWSDALQAAGAHDIPALDDLAHYMVRSDREKETYAEWLRQRTINFFGKPHVWAALEALTEELLNRRTLSARRARRVIREGAAAWLGPPCAHHGASTGTSA